jgi:hypothetical protein
MRMKLKNINIILILLAIVLICCTISFSGYLGGGFRLNYMEGMTNNEVSYDGVSDSVIAKNDKLTKFNNGDSMDNFMENNMGNSMMTPDFKNNNDNLIGINKNQIPKAEDDLYVLKSQIVPPVCPACPTVSACPRQEPPPPCPPCARCPEPSFECKKVPN